MTRKRAQSLFYHDGDSNLLSGSTLHRVQSDSDLSRVDRKRTFDESNQLSRPGELLARVVSALGSIRASEDDTQSILDMGMLGGINGFSDSQILASEQMESRWSLAYSDGSYAMPPPRERTRAASDFRAPQRDQLHNADDHKWTWSGNNSQIKEFMRLRKMNKRKPKDLYRAAFTHPKNAGSVFLNIPEPPAEAISPEVNNPTSILNRLNPFKKRTFNEDNKRASLTPDRLDIQNYLERTSAGRDSRMSLSPHQYLNATAKGRCSNFSILSTTDESNADVLEKTTIADLIRALEVVHTKANTGDVPLLQDFFESPKRKMGTASLSPPSTLPPLINIFPPVGDRNRRNSLHPFTAQTQTPVFNRHRRQSNILDHLSTSRRSSLLRPPFGQPPPYSEATPHLPHRRFSVRPTTLSIPPGQAPLPSMNPTIQASSTLQRRLSMRPSPLASGHYVRSVSTSSSGGLTPTSIGTPVTRQRNLFLRPVNETHTNVAANRRGSRSQIFEGKAYRKRSESK